MKKIYLFFLLLVSFTLLSCNSKDPGTGGGGTEVTDTTVTATDSFKQVQLSGREWDSNKRSDITYQLLVYSFADSDGDGTGDFNGITNNLDYIDALGATAIWLSPIHPASSYHGYDVLDYTAVNPEYGTMEDFKKLVNKAHSLDIKVYLDYVINHSASKHPWFLAALADQNSPYRDYYIFSDDPKSDIAAGKIAMINTEGSSGYDSGQWFTATSTENSKLKFTLNWTNSSKPYITVTKTETVDADNPDQSTSGAKYLYYGDGVCKKFYDNGDNTYSLSVDYSSSWGFLVRTSNDSSWPAGTKYGAQNSSSRVSYGVSFTLYTSSNNGNVYDMVFANTTQYHSHFWTSWFADLNYGAVDTAENSAAFREIVSSAEGWIDAGVDGFRLDAVKHIYHNATSDENPRFLKKFYDVLNSYFKKNHSNDLYMVGEVFSEHNEVAPYYAGLPSLFEFSFWWRLSDAINNGTGNKFASNIISYNKEYAAYRSDYIEATKLSNHDEDRACSTLGNQTARAQLAGAMLLTASGAPYIYYGEELGMTGTKSGGDENVRKMLDWDKIKTMAGNTSSILSVYRSFAEARNNYPALAFGTMSEHGSFNSGNTSYPSVAGWYMTYKSEKMLILHNTSAAAVTISLADDLKTTVVYQGDVRIMKKNGVYQLNIGAYSSVVFELN